MERNHGRLDLALVVAIFAASPILAIGEEQRQVNLYFYGDTRHGVVQSEPMVKPSRTGPRSQSNRPHHSQIVSYLGGIQFPRGSQRAILFLGDAVSVGGDPGLTRRDFLSSLRREVLCPAFCEPGENLQFYPVIGDHETYYLPTTRDTAAEADPHLPSYEISQRGFGDHIDGRTPCANPGNSYLDFKHTCTKQILDSCTRPHPARRDLCAECTYQEQDRHGNLATFFFDVVLSRQAGFASLQDARAKVENPGATWYALTYDAPSPLSPGRKLMVLMMDTQTNLDTGINREGASGHALTQLNWIRDEIRTMEPGTLLVLVGHQPPGTHCHTQKLYNTAIQEAFDRGIRLVAIIASHVHDFGYGSVTLSRGLGSATKPQTILYAISGDAGAHDFERLRIQDSAKLWKTIRHESSCRKGYKAPTVLASEHAPWQRKGKYRKNVFADAWIGQLSVIGDKVTLTPYAVGAPTQTLPPPITLDLAEGSPPHPKP